VEWWRDAIAATDPDGGHMTLVALGDDCEVLGYAKSGTHKDRPAYDTTVETSVYVAERGRGKGAGGALYDALLARLEVCPAVRLAVAGVAEPNEPSTRLHLSRGFTPVGRFTGIGTKFGRAWDVTWYERPLEPRG
jgi:phosphinothricin acetyltransferase